MTELSAPAISYSIGLTGSVTRTLQDHLDDFINAKAFGADGKDGSDDHLTLQAIIDGVETAGGGRIHVPKGAYLLSNALQVQSDYVVLTGDGPSISRLLTTSATAHVLDFNGGGTPLRRCGAAGLSLEKHSSVSSKTSGAGLRLFDVMMSRFAWLDAYGTYDGFSIGGTTIDSTNTLYFSDFNIRDVKVTTGAAVRVDKVVDLYMRSGTINAAAGSPPGAGFLITNCQSAWITDVDCLKHDIGFNVIAGEGGIVTWIFLKGCAFDKSTIDGIRVRATHSGAIIRGIDIGGGSWASSNGQHGIYIFSDVGPGPIDGVSVQNSFVFNNGRHGIRDRDAINVTLTGNEVSGNSAESVGTYNGIYIDAGTKKFRVRGNKSGRTHRFANTQAYGMLVPAGASDDYIITGNDFGENVIAGLVDNGTGIKKVVGLNLV